MGDVINVCRAEDFYAWLEKQPKIKYVSKKSKSQKKKPERLDFWKSVAALLSAPFGCGIEEPAKKPIFYGVCSHLHSHDGETVV